MNIYIDGENYRHIMLKALRDAKAIKKADHLVRFPLRQLLEEALDEERSVIRYYAARIKMPVGYVPSEDVQKQAHEIKESTRKLVPELTKQGIGYIKAGYLKVKTSKNCPNCGHTHDALQEKGVDVRLAADMLDDAYNKRTTSIVIFSSDTDLVPAIHKIKDLGIKVIYLAYAESINRAVSAVADSTVTFTAARAAQLFKDKDK